MNHAISLSVALVSLLMSALSSGQPERRFPIERSHPTLSEPLAAHELTRLAAGDPPPVKFQFWVSDNDGRSLFRYLLEEKSYQHATAKLGFVIDFSAEFSAAALVKAFDAEALAITRDTKGAIRKAGTQREWGFVLTEKNAIIIERYHSRDCAADENGEMKPLPGAKFESRDELRQMTFDPGKKIRMFQITRLVPGIEPQATVRLEIVLSEPKGRSKVVMREYIGLDPGTRRLSFEDSFERIIWPEGPGYQQIKRTEKYSDDQSHLVQHVVEKWRVDPTGLQQNVEEMDLRQKLEEEPSGEDLH